MTNYKEGKIYAIISEKTNLCYVGSTTHTLNQRLVKHKTDLRGFLGINKKYRNYRGSFDILLQDDYKIYLLQKYPCNCKKELERQESKWIFKMTNYFEVTNKNIPSSLGYDDLNDIEKLEF